jgi:glycosyltransferase involved in cell wall biosynthesis
VEEIADAMEKVLIDDALRDDLSRKGKERVKQFTWEKCARETMKVYMEVCGEVG